MKKIMSKKNRETGAAIVSERVGGRTAEGAAKGLFFVCAAFSALAVFTIVFYLLYVSIPVFREVGVFNFLFKRIWAGNLYADGEIAAENAFGIFPAVVSSLVVTLGAVVLGGALGIGSAIFTAHYCPKRFKGFYMQVINLLAGIPSVVFGFFGLVVLVPALQTVFDVPVGKGPLAAVLVLSLMIMPTVASVSKNSIEAVPHDYYEGALALGNTKAQAVFKVCVPAAKTGIFSALILGVGRAVGETMAVQMVVGNSFNWMPEGFFQGVCTMTTLIVSDMPYSSGLWRQALVATGFILLCFILVVNLCLNLVQKERKGTKSLFARKWKERTEETKAREHVFSRGGLWQEASKYVCIVSACFASAILGIIVVFISVKGIPNLTPNFLFGASSNSNATLKSALLSTFLTIVMTLAIALPLGIGAAVFLNEYSEKGSRLVKFVRLFVDTLSGIPSIVFGLFGMVFFVKVLGRRCLLAGSFTMVLIILPTIIRSTEESLREVPDSMREASLALGASKVRTIFRIVLPAALSGIVTSIILSVGRIVGESAALIYTAGATLACPSGYMSQGSTFAVLMYTLSSSGKADEFGQSSLGKTYATGFVLLAIVVCLNLLISLVERRLKGKAAGAASGGDGGKNKRDKFKRKTEKGRAKAL